MTTATAVLTPLLIAPAIDADAAVRSLPLCLPAPKPVLALPARIPTPNHAAEYIIRGIPAGRLPPMFWGQTDNKADRITTQPAKIVTVGREARGAEWGKGRAAAAFEAMRAEQSRIPLGQRTAHDLKQTIADFQRREKENHAKTNSSL